MNVGRVIEKPIFWACEKVYDSSKETQTRLISWPMIVVIVGLYMAVALLVGGWWGVLWGLVAAFVALVLSLVSTSATAVVALGEGARDGLLRGINIGLNAKDRGDWEHLLEVMEEWDGE